MSLNIRLNHISLDTGSLTHNFYRSAEAIMDAVSEKLQELFKKEIDRLGHGSSVMKSETKGLVKEVVKEVAYDHFKYQVGIDEGELKSMSEQVIVRASVVLHGNEHGGGIWTRPGQSVWQKHVNYKAESHAKVVKRLYHFEQPGDRAGQIADNAMKEIKKTFDDGLLMMGNYIKANMRAFVRVS